MVRRVRNEHCADDLRRGTFQHDFVPQSELPRRVRLSPRHLLKYRTQLRAQIFEPPEPARRWW